jgi:ubiquinone/menaquinone biosynthesis C-methylase UbiE
MKNEWTEEYAKELDRFWTNGLQELMLHSIEGVLAIEYAQKGDKILEVGCGTGRIYDVLRAGADLHYTGLDVSPAMLKLFHDRCPDVPLIEGNATALPFPDNSFDLVVCFEVIRHLQDYQKVIAEMHRVARRMALFNIEVCEGPSIYMDENRYGSYLAGQGKAEVLHYQVEHCASAFINWLRTAYSYNIELRTITNSKYAFALNKLQRGLSFTVAPVDGMQKLSVEILKCIMQLAPSAILLLNVSVGSIRPMSLTPTIVNEEGEKHEGIDGKESV